MALELEEQAATTTAANTTSKSEPTIVHLQSYHSSSSPTSTGEGYPVRDTIYNSAALEKTARAAELSAIKRALAKDVVVIADDLNYIKGFRYQLWCEAKAVGTRCCTVHCAAREEEVVKWNRARLRQWAESHGEAVPEEEGNAASIIDSHFDTKSGAGDILPESHTAVYGDRVPAVSSRSRSSSMDANNGEEIVVRPSTLIEESLQSFSLARQNPVSIEEISSPQTVELDRLPSTAAATIDFPPPTSPPYSSKTLSSLLMRYEPPSPFSKWDTPLFTVPSSDRLPPVSGIWNALFPPNIANTTREGGHTETKKEVKPHAATALPQDIGADALQILEGVTANLVAQIMAQIKEHPEWLDEGGGIEVRFADAVETLSIHIGTHLSLPMLQRLRRRFTQMQRGGIAHGRGYVKGEKAVGEAFIRFLNGEVGN